MQAHSYTHACGGAAKLEVGYLKVNVSWPSAFNKRDLKDMGQQMGFRSLEWNWPKEAMNIPIWTGIVDGAKLF